MAQKKSLKIALSVIPIIVIIIAVVLYVRDVAAPVERDVTGTIVSIDPDNRQATVEVLHPKTGELFELRGEVAPDCVILVGDETAELADLKPGMTIHAEGLLYKLDRRVVAQRVEAEPLPAEPAAPPTSPEETSTTTDGQETS